MPDFNAADPLEDYLIALAQLERAAVDADVLIPGHGAIGQADQIPPGSRKIAPMWSLSRRRESERLAT